MRTDTAVFQSRNTSPNKEPRFVFELAFDSANSTLRYFTSHSDAATPGGATVVGPVISGIATTSQELKPDTAASTIGDITVTCVDLASAVTAALGTQLAIGRSTRLQRARVYVGYK